MDKLVGVLADSPHHGVIVQTCIAPGLAVGHSAHVSVVGYVPATPFLERDLNTAERALTAPTAYSLGWFTEAQLLVLDATEPNYDRVVLPPTVRVTARSSNSPVSGVMVYRSKHGVLGEDGLPLALASQDAIHRWLAQRLPHLSGRSDTTSYADPEARNRVRVELIRRGLVVPSGLR